MYFVFCDLETEVARLLKQLGEAEKASPEMQIALKIRKALAQGNFVRFFKLYQEAPHRMPCLINCFIDKYRLSALKIISVGYVATGISVGYLTKALAFSNEAETCKFLTELGCAFKDAGDKLDCRGSIAKLKAAQPKVRSCKK